MHFAKSLAIGISLIEIAMAIRVMPPPGPEESRAAKRGARAYGIIQDDGCLPMKSKPMTNGLNSAKRTCDKTPNCDMLVDPTCDSKHLFMCKKPGAKNPDPLAQAKGGTKADWGKGSCVYLKHTGQYCREDMGYHCNKGEVCNKDIGQCLEEQVFMRYYCGEEWHPWDNEHCVIKCDQGSRCTATKHHSASGGNYFSLKCSCNSEGYKSSVTDTFAGDWKVYKDGVIAQELGQDLPNITIVSTLNSTLMWTVPGMANGSITWNGDKMFNINGINRDGKSVIGTYDGVSTIKWHGPIFGADGIEFVYLGQCSDCNACLFNGQCKEYKPDPSGKKGPTKVQFFQACTKYGGTDCSAREQQCKDTEHACVLSGQYKGSLRGPQGYRYTGKVCLPITYMCDNSPDCEDGSDEYNCLYGLNEHNYSLSYTYDRQSIHCYNGTCTRSGITAAYIWYYCEDHSLSCSRFGRAGYCTGEHEYYMRRNCAKTCNTCRECYSDSECPSTRPICDSSSKKCVELSEECTDRLPDEITPDSPCYVDCSKLRRRVLYTARTDQCNLSLDQAIKITYGWRGPRSSDRTDEVKECLGKLGTLTKRTRVNRYCRKACDTCDPWDLSRCPFRTGYVQAGRRKVEKACWALSAYWECNNDRNALAWVSDTYAQRLKHPAMVYTELYRKTLDGYAGYPILSTKQMWERYESSRCGRPQGTGRMAEFYGEFPIDKYIGYWKVKLGDYDGPNMVMERTSNSTLNVWFEGNPNMETLTWDGKKTFTGFGLDMSHKGIDDGFGTITFPPTGPGGEIKLVYLDVASYCQSIGGVVSRDEQLCCSNNCEMCGGARCGQRKGSLWAAQCCKAFVPSTQICGKSGQKAPCHFIGYKYITPNPGPDIQDSWTRV